MLPFRKTSALIKTDTELSLPAEAGLSLAGLALQGVCHIQQSNNFRAVFELPSATICDQKLDERIHTGKVCRVVDFTLMTGCC